MCSLHSQYLNPVAESDSATIHCLSQNAPERYNDAQGQKFYMGVTLGAVPFFPISSQRRKRCTIIGYDNVNELANVNVAAVEPAQLALHLASMARVREIFSLCTATPLGALRCTAAKLRIKRIPASAIRSQTSCAAVSGTVIMPIVILFSLQKLSSSSIWRTGLPLMELPTLSLLQSKPHTISKP